MGTFFRIFGVIQMVIVGFSGVIAVFEALTTAGLVSAFIALVVALFTFVLSMPLYILGCMMDEMDELRHLVYQNMKGDSKTNDTKVLLTGGWKCSCGRVNAEYVSTCACGKGRNVVEKNYGQSLSALETMSSFKTEQSVWSNAADPERGKQDNGIVADGGWKCSCGRANQSYISTCACGKSRHEAE